MFRLRSSTYFLRGHNMLCLPKPLTTSYGINSFSYLATTSWNSLPDHYRTVSDFTSFRGLIIYQEIQEIALFCLFTMSSHSFSCLFSYFFRLSSSAARLFSLISFALLPFWAFFMVNEPRVCGRESDSRLCLRFSLVFSINFSRFFS